MIFPFTFKFSVPDIINPFSLSPVHSKALVPARPNPVATPTPVTASSALARVQPRSSRHSSSISPPVIVSRKRGWEPAFGEDNPSSANLNGRPDTPKYGDMASRSNDNMEYDDLVDTGELPPPAKRHRGLAGSLVSTALSAALIGTAVGLTVYRLWRDRGKVTTSTASNQYIATEQLPPPPPYQETERAVAPTTPKTLRKHRSGAGHSKRSYHQTSYPHSHPRQRPTRARAHIPPALTSTVLFPPPQPEFDFDSTQQPSTSTAIDVDHQQPANEIEDHMDWIGDKLSTLISEGKRALGCEIVVMSDSKEDEVDDGSGAWEDSLNSESENNANANHLPTPSNSIRRRRAHTTASPSSSSQRRGRRHRGLTPPPSASAQTQNFNTETSFASSSFMTMRQTYSASTTSLPNQVGHLQAPSTPHRTHSHGLSLDSSPTGRGSGPGTWASGEDINSFESPELRETMERARRHVLMMRAAKSVDVSPMQEGWPEQ
ncbi:hypothetical protein AX15_007436 [Amanita polypyramis BW_CC]|nr:hypothetical protein AX15_007436 [Amanita polypyramis BW_CC]